MGPVEQAVRAGVGEGTVLRPPDGGIPFSVARFGPGGPELEGSTGESVAGPTWECLEGIVQFLAVRGSVEIGEGRGALGEHLGPGGADPGRVAAVLEAAGVLEVIRGDPPRARLVRSAEPPG